MTKYFWWRIVHGSSATKQCVFRRAAEWHPNVFVSDEIWCKQLLLFIEEFEKNFCIKTLGGPLIFDANECRSMVQCGTLGPQIISNARQRTDAASRCLVLLDYSSCASGFLNIVCLLLWGHWSLPNACVPKKGLATAWQDYFTLNWWLQNSKLWSPFRTFCSTLAIEVADCYESNVL